jgi:hypothetical protein
MRGRRIPSITTDRKKRIIQLGWIFRAGLGLVEGNDGVAGKSVTEKSGILPECCE